MDIIYIYYTAISLMLGIIILLIVHRLGDFPFPWQIRRLTPSGSEPDSLALSECFDRLSNNEEIHITMGNISHLVCEEDVVVNSLKNALEKNIAIKLIHGPEVDTRSINFLNLLKDNEKVKLYRHPTDPEIHFRVIIDAKGPKEVYVEEPHRPYEDHGFRRIHSRRASREYENIFYKMLRRSVRA